jgi:hypothetical protein
MIQNLSIFIKLLGLAHLAPILASADLNILSFLEFLGDQSCQLCIFVPRVRVTSQIFQNMNTMLNLQISCL